METIKDIQNLIPDFASDIKSNFSKIFFNSNYNDELIYGCGYACSLLIRNKDFSRIFETEIENRISSSFTISIKSIIPVITFYNSWYEFRSKMPSMEMKVASQAFDFSIISNYAGLEKSIFESVSLCISLVNGCSICIESYSKLLFDGGKEKTYILTIGRITSIIIAADKALHIKN